MNFEFNPNDPNLYYSFFESFDDILNIKTGKKKIMSPFTHFLNIIKSFDEDFNYFLDGYVLVAKEYLPHSELRRKMSDELLGNACLYFGGKPGTRFVFVNEKEVLVEEYINNYTKELCYPCAGEVVNLENKNINSKKVKSMKNYNMGNSYKS